MFSPRDGAAKKREFDMKIAKGTWFLRAALRGAVPLFLLFTVSLFLPESANAQFKSTVEGTVKDPSGALVPSAEIELAHEQTGITYKAVCNERGFFRIANLPAGTFRITVRSAGFQAWSETKIILESGQLRTVYPELKLGQTSQTIEVTAAKAVLETEPRLARTIEALTIETAPLAGRNVYAGVAALAPGLTGSGAFFGGASGSGSAGTDSFGQEPAFQINAGGQRQEANEYQVDGSSVNGNSRGGIVNLTPEPDTISEVRISANSFSADKGRNSGALIEVFTKSGSNNYHGTLSYFHSDNALSARTIFQKSLVPYRRNDFGGTFGGPIIKNKTFFFGSMSFMRSSTAQTFNTFGETPQFRQFVASTFPNSLANTFWKNAPLEMDPTQDFLTVAQVRTLYPGRLPSTMFPDTLPAMGRLLFDKSPVRNGTQWNMRIDHNFNQSKDRIYGQFVRTTSQQDQLAARPAYSIRVPNAGIFAKINWIHSFTPSLLNEASMTYVRSAGDNPGVPGTDQLPNVGIGGITGYNQWGPAGWVHNNYNWHEVMTWVRGDHNIRFGFDLDKQQDFDKFTYGLIRPSFGFNNLMDFAQDAPFSQGGPVIEVKTGSFASNLYQLIYMTYLGGYVQDDWKISRSLTLNLGVRYDYFGHLASASNSHIPYDLFTPGSGSTPQAQFANGFSAPRGGHFTNNLLQGVAPRIGFGWDIGGKGKMTLRGGYGMYYNRIANLTFANPGRTNAPTFANISFTALQRTDFSYALGPNFPVPDVDFTPDSNGGFKEARVGVSGNATDPSVPVVHNWSLSLQRQLSKDMAVELSYNGNVSRHQVVVTDMNRFAGDMLNGKQDRLNPSFSAVTFIGFVGESDAHVGSVTFSKRFSNSWSLRGIFTIGKSIDIISTDGNGVGGTGIYDAYNLNAQRGRSDFNVAKRFTMDSVWQLPDPWKRGVWSKVLGGWNLSAIMFLQSGQPFSVYTSAPYGAGGDFNADGSRYDPPNTPSFGNSISSSRSDFITGLFKRADFPLPTTPGVKGDLGRNTYEGPGLAQVNLNVMKTFRVPWFTKEGASLQIRGEIFNLFNRVNLTNPAGDLTSVNLGKSTNQRLARMAQFGIRIAY